MSKRKEFYKAVTGLKVSNHKRILVLKDAKDLSYPEKHLYLYICEVSSWGKGAFTKNRETIQNDNDLPKSTVQKYLKGLEDKGYIFRVSHYQSYSQLHPYRSSFIYPMKYQAELFYDKDILKINDNVEEELINIRNKTNEAVDHWLKKIREMTKEAKKRIEDNSKLSKEEKIELLELAD